MTTAGELHVRRPSAMAVADLQDRQWMVHLKGPVTTLAKDAINEAIAPYSLGDYLPHHTFLLTCPEAVAFRLSKTSGVIAVLEFHAAFKVHPKLQQK